MKVCARSGQEILFWKSLPTPKDLESLDSSLAQIREDIRNAIGGEVQAIGVGLPGLVSEDGVALFLPHLPMLSGVDVRQSLEENFDAPVKFSNDANCAGLAEIKALVPSQSGYEIVLGMGTGLGAALFTPHGSFKGASGFAGEVGHMCIDPDGRECTCGKKGCWERYCSASSLMTDLRELSGSARLATVDDLFSSRGKNAVFYDIIDRFCFHLAVGMSNLVVLLDVERIVLTGGLARSVGDVLPKVTSYLETLVEGGKVRRKTAIVTGAFFERAGAIGATYLWDQLEI